MRIMLVDDEKLALLQLERMVTMSLGNDSYELKTFQMVSAAMEEAVSFQPDVVFLDIHMPEMSGLEAADQLQRVLPNLEIIFVTAYDEFAVQAFELNAMDYLLKPVAQARLEKTMQRLKQSINAQTYPAAEQKEQDYNTEQKIYCFNKIRFQARGQKPSYPKWRTAKAQELFAYLLHRREEFVPKYKIINMFTPELDKKRAMTQLYTVVYQIRKCLKESGIEIIIDNDSIQEGYCMRLSNTWLDFEAWEQQLVELHAKSKTDSYYDELEQLLQKYEGDYMGDYDYLWAESERERLRQLWLQHAGKLMDYYYRSQNWTKLLMLGDRMYQVNPYEFELGVHMLEAYSQLGQYDKVKQYYERFERDFFEELELAPPDEMVEWYENWLAAHT